MLKWIRENRNNMRRIACLFLAVVMLCSMAACGGETAQPTEVAVSSETAIYTVTVETAGGMVMSGLDVYVYADNTLADLKKFGQTDENGQISFELPKSDSYAVTLSGVAKGYDVADSYAFNDNSARITLTSALIKDESLSGATLGLGDVMYDFNVLTPDGETVSLSQMLSEKKMVLLNFWYTTCSWCVTEFPFMEAAYQTYGEDAGIIALDPFDEDAAIKAFQADMGLTFPMAKCPSAWSSTFSVSGYPTSIVVDRYGVICLVVSGAIPSERAFMSIFEHFTADNYEQKLIVEADELMTNVKPDVTMEASETIAAAINQGEFTVTYRPETEGEDAEYAWPFMLTEKDGETCLKTSNAGIEDSYSIMYADFELEAGQAIGFDYLSSTEYGSDVMFVIVNDDDIYQISGDSADGQWKSCYPCVAEEAGTYELALCYLKDEADNVGEDTVYIKNMRVVSADEIDSATYLPREAAVSVDDGFEYIYAEVFLNETDGYYHVGSENGPLLLANLMGASQFNEEKSIFDLTYDGDIKLEDGSSIYEKIVDYCSYASNSELNGKCTVNAELAELLKVVADQAGFSDDENEWLKMCMYYQVYGSDEQLQDPIKGLNPASAYEAKLGKNIETNYFYYNRVIMPRGLIAEFVPATSGVYRITSRNESQHGVDGWIFDENRQELLTYEHDERMYEDDKNVSMVYYMEAGKPYYIDIAFWDVYETGYIYYDIEYIGATYNLFRVASPGYFTYDTNATGEAMYYTVSGGIKAVLNSDGYYYQDMGLDANGNQIYGSKIYADFEGITGIFDAPIKTVETTNNAGEAVTIKGLIDKGAFDFSKDESDMYILAFMANHDNDPEATDAYLRELWGADYDSYAEIYRLKDVYAGKYHGEGEDLTEEVRAYFSKIEKAPAERKGCVAVDERLAEILQQLLDKFTFKGVEQSWLKVCYYYDNLNH